MPAPIYTLPASGGISQVDTFADLTAGSDGDLAQLSDGRVMRYSSTVLEWLPAYYGTPSALREHLDGTSLPSDEGWTASGSIAATLDSGDIVYDDNNTGGGFFIKNLKVIATINAATSFGILVDHTLTRTNTSGYLNLVIGVGIGSDMILVSPAMTATLGAGNYALSDSTGAIPEHTYAAGEGPDNSAQQKLYIITDASRDWFEVGTLDGGPLFGGPVSGLPADSSGWFGAGAVSVWTSSAADVRALIHELKVWN